MNLSRLAFASLLLAGSASAWVPASSGRHAGRKALIAGRGQQHSLLQRKNLVARRSAVEDTSTSTDATAAGVASLEPEFAAALAAATAKLEAGVPPEMKTTMWPLLLHFVQEYMVANQAAFKAGSLVDETNAPTAAKRFLTAVQYGMQYGMGPNKFEFDVTHRALRGKDPEEENGNGIDFYKFGCDFFKCCMNVKESVVLGQDNLARAVEQLKAGENVVFLANHQSEADPQVVSTLLESIGYSQQAEDCLYVAGHKVTTDPLAIPFSMGRNLICIHSKKHIDADKETKPIKQKQNLRAMGGMLDRLKQGGTLLWVAPSGGRDRRSVETDTVDPAPFDSKTIDMFRLMGNKSRVKTHYYTLAMVSYTLCPPPDFVAAGVGEERNVRFVPVGIACGEELESVGGLEKRKDFCNAAYTQCSKDYRAIQDALAEN